jgi:hypothetical protein
MTPTLTAPGPLTYSEYFPIPMSFFQDIQQENFWSIGVRQFGNSIFHYRTLTEGARKDYNVTDEAEGKFKKSKAARFKERTNLKNDNRLNWKFRFDLKGLKAAINLTPDERIAMKFGQRLLLSSKMQQDFFNDVEEQEASIQSITDTITSATLAGNSPDNIRKTFLSIFTFTQQAIRNHERMVAGTISQENADGVAYSNRRAKLLAWNKGTRSFARQLVDADGGRNLDLNAEELQLELCRMALWYPTDAATKSGTDWLEILILQNARQALNSGNVQDCRNTCTRLLRENWRSLFADCAARAILFSLEKNVSEGWPGRVVELQAIAGILESLKAGAPAYWKDEVLALQAEVAGLIAPILAAPVPFSFSQ